MRRVLILICGFAVTAPAQWELGGTIGYGIYRNGSIISSAGTADAGIRNRFTAGAIIGEDLYDYVSGEFRYLYQDGDPFISLGDTRTNIQGQSHSFHYNLVVHTAPREHWIRPYAAVGVGAKWFVTTGPVPERQPLERIGVLNPTNHLRPLVTVGGGVKFDVRRHVRLRVEFLDYITPFPNKMISPGAGATARGILHQFTPMIGISGVF